MKAPTPLQEQFSMPPTPALVAIAQSCNGVHKQRWDKQPRTKKMEKK
jgi:hypothetical protein